MLLRILPHYASFLASNPCSLLLDFFGLASFALPRKHGGTLILVIMENVLRPKPLGKSGWFTRSSRRQRIHEVYDLKGSTKGRGRSSAKVPQCECACTNEGFKQSLKCHKPESC